MLNFSVSTSLYFYFKYYYDMELPLWKKVQLYTHNLIRYISFLQYSSVLKDASSKLNFARETTTTLHTFPLFRDQTLKSVYPTLLHRVRILMWCVLCETNCVIFPKCGKFHLISWCLHFYKITLVIYRNAKSASHMNTLKERPTTMKLTKLYG